MTLGLPITHGNLLSYKRYTIFAARKKCGCVKATSAYQKGMQRILHVLFVNGISTTWDMARADLEDVASIRSREKTYRRLLIGRTDRGKHSHGLLNMGLIIEDKGEKSYSRYRLSLYGILYCLDILDPSKRDIDSMAVKYARFLPRVFGLWRTVKSVLGTDAYNLRILAQGIYLDNVTVARSGNPLYELMSYIHIKYAKNFEYMPEDDLADQISYWFYTYLLHRNRDKLERMLVSDEGLCAWYMEFFCQARAYYADRIKAMGDSIL